MQNGYLHEKKMQRLSSKRTYLQEMKNNILSEDDIAGFVRKLIKLHYNKPLSFKIIHS